MCIRDSFRTPCCDQLCSHVHLECSRGASARAQHPEPKAQATTQVRAQRCGLAAPWLDRSQGYMEAIMCPPGPTMSPQPATK
eukprot:13841998-Alexandrium_andersonii.AAC.1